MADDKGKVMLCQISPVLYGEAPASDKFLAVFEVSLPPLGVTHYRVTGTGSQTDKNTVRAKVQYINMQPPARGYGCSLVSHQVMLQLLLLYSMTLGKSGRRTGEGTKW